MAENSKIEWTHHTANLWWGCTKVHAGCDHCYAETLAHRWDFEVWGNDKPRRIISGVWNDLDRYQKLAAKAGEIHRVFVGSMMDIFEKPFPVVDSKGYLVEGADTGMLRYKLFKHISEGRYPNLMFLLLTKRPSNINKYIPDGWKSAPPANVMFGTSVVNQETANHLIMQLASVRGHGQRFISVEPQLAPIDLTAPMHDKEHSNGRLIDWVDWVIVGGESGPGKRPFDPEWARTIRDDCAALNTPFFMKQWDKVKAIPDDLLIREFPRVAKSEAGPPECEVIAGM